MGPSPGALPGMRPRLRAQSGRHVGVHDRRGSAAGRRDHHPDLLRLRPDPSRARPDYFCHSRCRAGVDRAEPLGRRDRAPLPVARVLARPVGSGAGVAGGPRLRPGCATVPWLRGGAGSRIAGVTRAACAIVLAAATAAACSRTRGPSNPLISASTTMVTAWQIPLDPSKEPLPGDAKLTDQIKWGYRIFVDTPREASRFTGGKVACANCHLNAGQRERAL